MDVILSDKQIKQFSLSISINDVLNCIRKDYNSYLNFLNEELQKKEITEYEYQKELMLIEQLKKNDRKEVAE